MPAEGIAARGPRRRAVVALAASLLAASLLALVFGRFIQFDDTSGFGHQRWIVPLGPLAGVLAVAAVLVALRDRVARRGMGAALAVVDVALVVLSLTDDGFRFVWERDSGELVRLEVLLALLAILLLAPAYRSRAQPAAGSRRRLTGWARATGYASALVVGMYVAFGLGSDHFESVHCSGPGWDGDCDTSSIEGLVWAGGVLLVGLTLVVVVELIRRRVSRAPGTTPRV